MSLYRENVTWESADGGWKVGFYRVVEPWQDEDDSFDAEWDVDYDFGEFEDVYTGPTREAADQAASLDRPNPGQTQVVRNTPENTGKVAKLDGMAADLVTRRLLR